MKASERYFNLAGRIGKIAALCAVGTFILGLVIASQGHVQHPLGSKIFAGMIAGELGIVVICTWIRDWIRGEASGDGSGSSDGGHSSSDCGGDGGGCDGGD